MGLQKHMTLKWTQLLKQPNNGCFWRGDMFRVGHYNICNFALLENFKCTCASFTSDKIS